MAYGNLIMLCKLKKINSLKSNENIDIYNKI